MKLENLTAMSLKIKVECYNDEHKKLLNDPTRYDPAFISNMNKIIENGIEITGAEFLVNSLYHKKETKPSKYYNRQVLVENIKNSLHLFEDDLELSHGSLRVQEDTKPEAAIVMKRVGESIGLSVISRVIGATEADWSVIPELNVKAFDFGYAVTNIGLVHVETKGSSSNNNEFKSNNIYQQANKILKKKEGISIDHQSRCIGDYNFGTITVSEIGGCNIIKCYLLDPPSDNFEMNLEQAMLTKKLGFYFRIMNFIAPESKLMPLLKNRIINLGKGNVKTKNLEPLPYLASKTIENDNYDSFFFNKSSTILGDSKAWGDWLHYKKNHVVFIGMESSLLKYIVLQDTNKLLNIKSEVSSHEIEVDLSVSTRHQREQLKKLEDDFRNIKISKNSNTFKAKGCVTLLASGIIVGVLRVLNK